VLLCVHKLKVAVGSLHCVGPNNSCYVIVCVCACVRAVSEVTASMFVYFAGNRMYLEACLPVQAPSFDCRGDIPFNSYAVEFNNKINILILICVSINYSFLRSLRQVQSAISFYNSHLLPI
jgi:hypothetical protein